jgi:23S rRNA pseudouridine1911/1915/1917 synthase
MSNNARGKTERPVNRNQLEILFEDRYLTVISKPAGLLSVPFPGYRGKTAVDLLYEIRRKRGLVSSKSSPLAVHRLDRETSGVMMFALTRHSRDKIMNSWNMMVSERLYHALAENPGDKHRSVTLLSDEGIIDVPLAYNAQHKAYVPSDNSVLTANPNVAATVVTACTRYRILKRGNRYSLFELNLETGRKNQIRAHLAYFGYPIAGDDVYGSRTNPAGRLCLHARTLAFAHPYTGETLRFEIPEPAEWASFLD